MKKFLLVLCIIGLYKISLAQTNTFPSSGNVGIGIISPIHTLSVNGKVGGPTYISSYIEFNNNTNIAANNDVLIGYTQDVTVKQNGNVGIGTTSPSEKLSVNGKIRAKEVKVETGWSDFVFDPSYKLRGLKETEEFIKDNKHLPEIPSAKEVAENGINLGEMNAKLLQKIEELTLYLIQKDKEISELKESNKRIDELAKKIDQLSTKQ